MTTEAHDSAHVAPGDAETPPVLLSPVEALAWASQALRRASVPVSEDPSKAIAFAHACSTYAEATAIVFDADLQVEREPVDEASVVAAVRAVRIIVDEARRRGPRHPALTQIAETLDAVGVRA